MSVLRMLTRGAAQQTYVDDVFVPFVRTGTGASQVTTTNIDMTQGYALWTKGRSGATDHSIYHSARGVTKDLVTNTTAAETTEAQGLTAVSSTGHTYGTLAKVNTNAATYVDWVLRNAAKFYTHSVVVKSASSNATVDLSTLGTVGMVRVKRTDSTGSWYVWHRSLTAGKLLIGETTAAEATLGHITVSGTTVTLVDGVIADGTYLVEGFAHDDSSTGIIQCGSFTTDGSGNATVTLGWEPQYINRKQMDGADGWNVVDSSRGFSMTASVSLYPNASNAEYSGPTLHVPTSTGFNVTATTPSATYIYLAIRRPNKPPTSGTQVYQAIARTGTGAAATVTGVGFAPDLVMMGERPFQSGWRPWLDRLRGAAPFLSPAYTSAETLTGGAGDLFTAFGMDGVSLGPDTEHYGGNQNTTAYINHFFRRAPKVLDIVAFTASNPRITNRSLAHNLTTAPELAIFKSRGGIGNWIVYHAALGQSKYLLLNSTAAEVAAANIWTATPPTSSAFNVDETQTMADGVTQVLLLFATLAGISKVGSYTGNGTTQNIEMGFSAGARFFLVKATSTTGNWVLFDTVRGIIAGSDPYLLLNSTAAEDTDEDAVDPYAGGIAVNETSASNINTNSVSYAYLALA